MPSVQQDLPRALPEVQPEAAPEHPRRGEAVPVPLLPAPHQPEVQHAAAPPRVPQPPHATCRPAIANAVAAVTALSDATSFDLSALQGTSEWESVCGCVLCRRVVNAQDADGRNGEGAVHVN